MAEKMLDFLEHIREKTVGAGCIASDAVCSVSAKAMELLNTGRRNARLAELESAVLTELRHVGEMIYATHTGNPTDSEVLLAKLREIDALHGEIRVLKQEAAAARGLPVCGVCGRVGEQGDLFCRDCGRQL